MVIKNSGSRTAPEQRSMTKGRKTTQQEKAKIFAFYIEYGKNYPLTIEKGVIYYKTYSWVRKYEKKCSWSC